MSTPRFKKDKEIIADYESQVKGKRECLAREMCLLESPGIIIGTRLSLVQHNLHMSHSQGGGVF